MSFRHPRRCAAAARAAVAVLILLGAAVACSGDDGRDDAAPDTELGPTVVGAPEARPANANSADRLLFWSSCQSIIELSDADLERFVGQGVDGFVCVVGRIRGLGGRAAFTPLPDTLDGAAHEMQRALRDTGIVARATAMGMKLYLGFYATNEGNHQTPFVEWFDDRGWAEEALPNLESFAATAQQLGFAGVAIDQEIYAPDDGSDRATWEWDYPGNAHEEVEVRAQVRERGAQVMQALLAGFPGLEVLAYASHFPGTWEDVVQLQVNGIEDRAQPMVHVNFWDGMTSVDGYAAVRFLNAVFYKINHIQDATWDTAFAYEYNQLASLFSRSFSNWSYASSRVFASPFIWISEGGTDFERAREPEYVAEQLEAFSRWGMGGEFANFAYNGVEYFDYSPYAPAMEEFSSPRVVDDEAPQLSVQENPEVTAGSNGASAGVQGTASDDLAIWAVRWANDRGGSGTAQLTWEIDWEQAEGDFAAGFTWQTHWSIDAIPLQPGINSITISADGIKGPSSSVEVTADG